MSETVLKHPLVRDYLRALDAACAALPPARASELRDQIAAHLDEALSPDATDAQVRAELARLGTPRALAAEAASPVPPSAAARLVYRLARLRWPAWAAIAAGTALVAAAAVFLSYIDGMRTAEPLRESGLETPWYPQDQASGSVSSAGDVSQVAIPERYGQWQGFAIGIVNDSDRPQTVLGLAPVMTSSQDFADMTASVAKGLDEHGNPVGTAPDWGLPAVIPPRSGRLLRVVWITRQCARPGEISPLTYLSLRVQIGLITRTEDIQLNPAWALLGSKSSDRCVILRAASSLVLSQA
jgi:hypothetical protein